MSITPSACRRDVAGAAGYSLVELLIAMGIFTAVMGATMATMSDGARTNAAILHVSTMNNTLRTGMDLMVRDLLQVGSGLPPGRVIEIPNGAGSGRVKIPGPPGTAFLTGVNDVDLAAVFPGDGKGPTINGVATDTITFLTADNTFTDVRPATTAGALTDTTATFPVTVNLNNGIDRVSPGQLMMIKKNSSTTLVQVTAINLGTRTITFGAGDSLNLNQPGVIAAGSFAALNREAPDVATQLAAAAANTSFTRVRMISYYLDATTDSKHPRLVRRVNNGHPTTFNNTTLGTAVANDIWDLQFTYDLTDGNTDPANVSFTNADIAGTGVCPAVVDEDTGLTVGCLANAVRKVNIVMVGRSSNAGNSVSTLMYRNTLRSQVSFRGMAFIDQFRETPQ